METIKALITFVVDHKVELIAAYTSLVTVASIIVKLTPTLKDDHVLKGVIQFIGKYLAINHTVKVEDETV